MAESTGLLDFLNSPGGMGLLSAVGAGLAGARRGGTWNAVGSGLLGGVQGYAQGQDLQRQNEYAAQRGKLFDMQAQQLEAAQAAAKAEAERAAARNNYLSGVGQVTSPRLDAQPNAFDPLKWRAMGGSMEEAKLIAEAPNLGKAKIKDFKEIRNPDGSVSVVGFDEFGNVTNTKQTPFRAPEVRSFGGYIGGIDPITGKVTNYGQVTMSAAEKDASARGWGGLSLQRDQFAYSKSKDAQERADKMAGGTGNATEDERKAAGWLAQASTAWSNMQKAMGGVDPKTGKFKNPDVAMPGLPDAIAAIPSFGLGEVVGNTMRSPARQQFNQASSSMGEAILRAATGAGVNQYEAEQKVRELTPVFGEDPTTTEQKMRAIPVYLDSLKARAGRAAPKDWTIPVVNAPSDGDGWSIRPK